MDYNTNRNLSAEMYDQFHNQDDDLSLEGLMQSADITIGCHADIMRFKRSLSDHVLKVRTMEHQTSAEALYWMEYVPTPPQHVENDGGKESTIVIDTNLLYDVFCSFNESVVALIKQLDAIPEDGILNVIMELGFSDLNFATIEAGVMIANMIRRTKGTKIFNMGSQMGISDLLVAQCCNKIYVSDFASVSITKADTGAHISNFLIGVYNAAVKSTYDFWIKRGLFKQEEVDDLFAAEADNGIQLLSDEIKSRIQASPPEEA